MRHDLRKDEFARVHERAQQFGWKNRKCYGRRSNRDQPRTRNNSFPFTRPKRENVGTLLITSKNIAHAEARRTKQSRMREES